MSCTFDTNILVYTLGQPADVKRQRAQSLIIRGARRQTTVAFGHRIRADLYF